MTDNYQRAVNDIRNKLNVGSYDYWGWVKNNIVIFLIGVIKKLLKPYGMNIYGWLFLWTEVHYHINACSWKLADDIIKIRLSVDVRNKVGNWLLFPLGDFIKRGLPEIDIDKQNPFAHTAQGNGEVGGNCWFALVFCNACYKHTLISVLIHFKPEVFSKFSVAFFKRKAACRGIYQNRFTRLANKRSEGL